MNFDIFGPFEITRHGQKRLVFKQSLQDLFSELKYKHPGLEDACGCYVFAIRAGKGYTPYYVGQSCKNTIVKEAFNTSNREKYNKALSESAGTPVLFLIAMLTPGGKYRKKTQGPWNLTSVIFLERWLIAKALEKNPHLINSKETRFLRKIHVTGLLNAKQGEATNASRELISAIK